MYILNACDNKMNSLVSDQIYNLWMNSIRARFPRKIILSTKLILSILYHCINSLVIEDEIKV